MPGGVITVLATNLQTKHQPYDPETNFGMINLKFGKLQQQIREAPNQILEPMKYKTRPISWLVGPKDCSIYDDMATTVSIDNEGGGEYIVLRQSSDNHDGEIRITPEEWLTLKAAIDKALTYAKGDPEMIEATGAKVHTDKCGGTGDELPPKPELPPNTII